MSRLILLCAILISGCQADESVAAYLDGSGKFRLISIDGAPFEADVTIDLSEAGRIRGAAPCNRYFADQTAPYPWFEIGPIGATRMACPALDQETAYFGALAEMTLAEALGGTLILSNTDGREMVFQAPWREIASISLWRAAGIGLSPRLLMRRCSIK